MKQLFLCLMILATSLCAKATNFTLVIATTDTAYAYYVIALAAVDTDVAHINALGKTPTQPNYDSTGAQWSAFVSLLTNYNTSLTTYQDSLAVHKATLRTNELAVLTTLGYNTAYTNICASVWVKVSGNNFPTAWIGFSLQSTYLYPIVFTQPTQAYPLY